MKYPSFWRIAAVVALQACVTPVFATPVKPGSKGTYAVKPGDTFAKIARSNGVSLPALLKANHISNPSRIVRGQQVVIPRSRQEPERMAVSVRKKAPVKAPASISKTALAAKKASHAPVSPKKQLPLITETKRRLPVNTTVNLTPPPPKNAYVVQSGDTLTRIQRRTGTPLSEILRLNKLTATSPIRPGQTLRLSAASAGKVVAANPPKTVRPANREPQKPVMAAQTPEPVRDSRAYGRPSANDSAGQAEPTGISPHKVGAGETFSSIRRTFGVTQTQLAKANPGVDPNRLHPGQTLMIPGQPVRPQVQVQAKPLIVRADGRVLAQRHDPLVAAGGSEEVSTERTRTGYLVEDGENIQKIAQRFNTTDREIRRLNRMGDTDEVYPGRYILVPFIRQALSPGAYARHDA